MSERDILTIFIPIITNGIFLYILQLHITRKLSKVEEVRVFKKGIYDEFFKCADKVLKTYRELIYILVNQTKEEDSEEYVAKFNDKYKQLSNEIRELKNYLEDYSLIIDKGSSIHAECSLLVDKFNTTKKNSVDNSITFLKEGEEMIRNVRNEVLKMILSI